MNSERSEFEKVIVQIFNELGIKPMGDTTGDSTHLNLLSALEQKARGEVTGNLFGVKSTELFLHPDPEKNIFNCPDCLEITGRMRTALNFDLNRISHLTPEVR